MKRPLTVSVALLLILTLGACAASQSAVTAARTGARTGKVAVKTTYKVTRGTARTVGCVLRRCDR